MSNTSRDHWGKHLWGFMHTMTICDFELTEANLRTQKPIRENIKSIVNIIPCPECRSDFIQHLSTIDKVDLYKKNSLFYWTIDFHNKVNEKLKKQILTYKQAEDIWLTTKLP